MRESKGRVRFRFEKGSRRESRWGLVYGGLTLAALVTSRFFARWLYLVPPCAFHAITGVPCPSCGATRSAVFLAHGHVVESFLVNPLFFFLYAGLVLWAVFEIYLVLRKEKFVVSLTRADRLLLRIGVVLAVAANWLYLILSGAADRYHP